MTEIRPATSGDLAVLVALDAALFGRNAWSESAMQAEVTAPRRDRVALVAEQPPGVVGYAIGLLAGDTADLLRIGVAPPARRSGVASRLLADLVERAASAGCSRLLLEVAVDDQQANAFYRQHEFVELDRRAGYYPDGSDAAVLWRPMRRTAS